MLIVRRSKPTSNFLIIPNGALFDERLSYIARGVLHELLGRPPGWQTNAEAMAMNAQRHRGARGESKRALRMAFKELEAAGYMVRTRTRVPKGQPNGGDFLTVLTLYDVPQNGHHEDGIHEGSMHGGFMREGLTDWESLQRTDVESTEEKDEAGQHSSALAGARAGAHASEQDRLRSDLQGLYDAADKLDDDRLRRHLLAFERRRPQIYRECRQAALAQIGKKPGGKQLMAGPQGARVIDLLSFKYALQHYVDRLPDWLVKLPR